MDNSSQQGTIGGPETILKVLEKKAFYEARFLKQILNLYPSVTTARLAPLIYIREVMYRIPLDHQSATSAITARLLVDNYKECPSPTEVRAIIAEAVLLSFELTFDKLYERAKDFLAFPPTKKEIAERWLEKVIYTTVRTLTRERFVSVQPDEWRRTVTDVILSEIVELVAYEAETYAEPKSVKHDFKSLLRPNP